VRTALRPIGGRGQVFGSQPSSKRVRAVPGADGSGERDGADTGGWVFLQLVEQAIGREVPGKVRAPAPARG
jgi:hypothetical protein